MENDNFYHDRLIERLEKFAQIHGVPTEEIVSIRLRPLQKNGSKAYVAWPSHEGAIELAGVSRVPRSTTFFGAEYLPGGFRAYQTEQEDIIWIPHEDGLEWIGLALGIIGAVEPTIKGIKWLVNRLMGKPERDIYQPYPVHSISVEIRQLREGSLYQQVIIERMETIIENEKEFLHILDERVVELRRRA
jgi:hypothetical protein